MPYKKQSIIKNFGSNWLKIDYSNFATTPINNNTIALSDTSFLTTGTPLKYSYGGSDYYGIITNINPDISVNIAGAPLDVGQSISSLFYGNVMQVITISLYINGAYGDNIDTDLLLNDMNSPYRWRAPSAYLVAFQGRNTSQDSSSNPSINIEIGGVPVSSNNSSNGVSIGSEANWFENPSVFINTNAYNIEWNDELEVSCTVAGGTGDAENLTVMCTFILA